MSGRRILLVSALVVALAAAGCGGGDDGGSSKDKLIVAQANSDVLEFCSVAVAKQGDVYDRAYIAMLDAVDTLSDAYKKDKTLEVSVALKRPAVPVEKIVKDSLTALKRCGRDGRQQAGRLQQAIK